MSSTTTRTTTAKNTEKIKRKKTNFCHWNNNKLMRLFQNDYKNAMVFKLFNVHRQWTSTYEIKRLGSKIMEINIKHILHTRTTYYGHYFICEVRREQAINKRSKWIHTLLSVYSSVIIHKIPQKFLFHSTSKKSTYYKYKFSVFFGYFCLVACYNSYTFIENNQRNRNKKNENNVVQ